MAHKWEVSFGTKEGWTASLPSDHEDFKEISASPEVKMKTATLYKGSGNTFDALIHHLTFNDVELIRIFNRTEKGLMSGKERVIPVLEYKEKGVTKYAFAFPDQVFITKNRRFYREDWSHG